MKREGGGLKRKTGGVQWSEEGIGKFTEGFRSEEVGEGGIEEEWKRLKTKIGEALGNMDKRVAGGGKKGWWDEECRVSKEKVRKELRKY